MQRRSFLGSIGTVAAAHVLWAGGGEAGGGEAGAASAPGFQDVVAMARARASEPHEEATLALAAPYDDLTYDRYRGIRFREAQDPIGRGLSGFGMDLLPPGLVFRDRVDISILRDGRVDPLPFTSEAFDFDPRYFDLEAQAAEGAADDQLSYSGFRLRHPINRPDRFDEFAVFQGASYFRAIARNFVYGLSARGLALNTADSRGEEFPVFRRFWVREPSIDRGEVTVFALLESASVTGAFRFDIRPGESTVMDTRCRLFPRSELDQVGIAPLTSMFYFGPISRAGVDDFRAAVHDSEGLQVVTGTGDRIWRPLSNPGTVQVSAFVDDGPRGFGLVQRTRGFAGFQDTETQYERRPSAWVEPLGDWGEGAVMLVEIPVRNEFNDNIVAFWRPKAPLQPTDKGHRFAYRLHWCDQPPDRAPVARVVQSRSGALVNDPTRRVVAVDFAAPGLSADGVSVDLWASVPDVSGPVVKVLPGSGRVRVAIDFAPGDSEAVELRVALVGPDGVRSETWLHRWTLA